MAAGDVASISGLGSALRSDCEAGLPTETVSGLIGVGAFDILRRKVPSARGAAWGRRKSGADHSLNELRLNLVCGTHNARHHRCPSVRALTPSPWAPQLMRSLVAFLDNHASADAGLLQSGLGQPRSSDPSTIRRGSGSAPSRRMTKQGKSSTSRRRRAG
jgi:hypothetical protein